MENGREISKTQQNTTKERRKNVVAPLFSREGRPNNNNNNNKIITEEKKKNWGYNISLLFNSVANAIEYTCIKISRKRDTKTQINEPTIATTTKTTTGNW